MEDLKVDKDIKAKKIEKLYVVIKDRLGLNVDSEFDQIGIRRVEARRIERERRDVAEAAEATKNKGKGKATEDVVESSKDQESSNASNNALVISQLFNLIGTPVSVSYSKKETKRCIEVERRRSKSKKNDDKDDDEDDDDKDKDEDLDDLFK
ncbi:hypothetical protein Hanom_Chr11g01042811 [Helianthus anomalus]